MFERNVMEEILKDMEGMMKSKQEYILKEKEEVDVMIGDEGNYITELYGLTMWKTIWGGKKIIGIKFKPMRLNNQFASKKNRIDLTKWKMEFCEYFIKKITQIITTLTNELMIIDNIEKRKSNVDSITCNEFDMIYKEVSAIERVKVMMNNELSIEKIIKENETNTFSPFNSILNSADQNYHYFKEKNISLIIEQFPNFPGMVKCMYNSFKSFFMTQFYILSQQVSNAEIKISCESEDAQGDHQLEFSIKIKMNNPSGVPPQKTQFDEQIEATGSSFDDTLPFLLKAVNSYMRLFCMMVNVSSDEIDTGLFKVKETIYTFKFKVSRGDSRNIINIPVMNFRISCISPNENIFEWAPVDKNKSNQQKTVGDGSITTEKMERISEKIIDKKRLNPDQLLRPQKFGIKLSHLSNSNKSIHKQRNSAIDYKRLQLGGKTTKNNSLRKKKTLIDNLVPLITHTASGEIIKYNYQHNSDLITTSGTNLAVDIGEIQREEKLRQIESSSLAKKNNNGFSKQVAALNYLISDSRVTFGMGESPKNKNHVSCLTPAKSRGDFQEKNGHSLPFRIGGSPNKKDLGDGLGRENSLKLGNLSIQSPTKSCSVLDENQSQKKMNFADNFETKIFAGLNVTRVDSVDIGVAENCILVKKNSLKSLETPFQPGLQVKDIPEVQGAPLIDKKTDNHMQPLAVLPNSENINPQQTREEQLEKTKIDINKGTKGLQSERVKKLQQEFTNCSKLKNWEAEDSLHGYTKQLECMRSMIRGIIRRELDRRGYLKEKNDFEDDWLFKESRNDNEYDCNGIDPNGQTILAGSPGDYLQPSGVNTRMHKPEPRNSVLLSPLNKRPEFIYDEYKKNQHLREKMERIVNRSTIVNTSQNMSLINTQDISYGDYYEDQDIMNQSQSALMYVPFKKIDEISFQCSANESNFPEFVSSIKVTQKRRWLLRKNAIVFPNDFTILFVDDSHNQLSTIKRLLEKTNVKVETALDGHEAFVKVKEFYKKGFMYMLILMDVHMPNFDGYDGTKMIRNFEEVNDYPRSYIICVTADDTDLTLSKSKQFKMDNFMIKPISKPILYKLISARCQTIGFDSMGLNMN